METSETSRDLIIVQASTADPILRMAFSNYKLANRAGTLRVLFAFCMGKLRCLCDPIPTKEKAKGCEINLLPRPGYRLVRSWFAW